MHLKNEMIVSLVMWMIMVGASVWGYVNVPDVPMAVHFGIDGTPNGFQPRDVALVMMPGLSLVLLVLLLWLLPAIMPKNASIERSAGAYGIVVLATTGVLTVTHAILIFRAAGLNIDETRVTLSAVGILFMIIGNYLPKTRKNWLMGVRTPWTLSDERVWDKTHRFAGPLFMLCGAVVVLAAFVVPVTWRIAVLVAAVAIPAALSVIYSYLVARKLGTA